jgi:hypothetical protein
MSNALIFKNSVYKLENLISELKGNINDMVLRIVSLCAWRLLGSGSEKSHGVTARPASFTVDGGRSEQI